MRLYDDIVFAEFDRNLNFVPDDILLDVVACLENHEKYSPCWMNFVSDGIVDSLME
jgi:hypothetical protein